MRNFKLTVAYDGTEYVGWQVQPNGPSIQSQLQSAWQQITGEEVHCVGSGRTNAGVHAEGQVCSIESETLLGAGKLTQALNASLPEDIRVMETEETPSRFHALRDAVSKTYRYQIQCGAIRDPFARSYRWHVRTRLNLADMVEASHHLVGEHDFAAFQATGSERASTVRNVSTLDIRDVSSDAFVRIDIWITANGFLYNMVRNIVGTLVEVGKGRRQPGWVRQVLDGRDRNDAGPTAPAHGLFLSRVDYASD